MIYLKLRGRIGNQLFMYATARTIQWLKGDDDTIVIEDYKNQANDSLVYENSLVNYPLHNVEFVHDLSIWHSVKLLPLRIKWLFISRLMENTKNFEKKYMISQKYQWFYNRCGVFHIQDGYVPYPSKFKKNVYVDGYFQSEKFFEPIKNEIKETFLLKEETDNCGYPNIDKIRERNTICISAKVQHNVGNKMYDVCDMDYYAKAINYMTEHVDNPLFFICSDDVEYVKENLIDTSKYDVVCQDSKYPVHISLAVMALCKHFIIGNTSFGWWAQYLSEHEDKIVVAPSKWYGAEIPQEIYKVIYQDNWTLIEV